MVLNPSLIKLSQWLRVRARIVNYFGYGYGTSSRDANMTAMTANDITVSCTFDNGQQFASFQELLDRIAEFEQQSYVQLYIRRSRTIEAAMKRAPKKVLSSRTEIFGGGLYVYSWWKEICFPFKNGKERTIRKTSALCRNVVSRTPPSDVYCFLGRSKWSALLLSD